MRGGGPFDSDPRAQGFASGLYTDPNGDALCWASSGTVGFKGSRKSTPFAAQRAAFAEAEKRLACEGLMDPAKHKTGSYDTAMRTAMPMVPSLPMKAPRRS